MEIILARTKVRNSIWISSIKKKKKKKREKKEKETVTELGINFDFLIIERRCET